MISFCYMGIISVYYRQIIKLFVQHFIYINYNSSVTVSKYNLYKTSAKLKNTHHFT